MRKRMTGILLSVAVAFTLVAAPVQTYAADDNTEKSIADRIKDAAESADTDAAKEAAEKAKDTAEETVKDAAEEAAKDAVKDATKVSADDAAELIGVGTDIAAALFATTANDALSAYHTYVSGYPNAAVSDLKVYDQTVDTVSLSFTTVPNAQLYRIKYWPTGSRAYEECYAIDEEAATSGTTKTKSIYATIYNLSNGEYTFQVTAANYNAAGGIRHATDLSSQSTLYATIKTAPAPAKPSAIKVGRLEMNADGDGYLSVALEGLNANSDSAYISQVYVYNYNGKKLLSFTGGASGASKTSPKIENNRFYSIKARGVYKRSDGVSVYGAWSDTIYAGSSFDSVKYAQKDGVVTAKWGTYRGADKYIVYISKKRNSGYKKVASTKDKTFKIRKYGSAKLKKKTTYYVKVRAYHRVGEEVVTMDSTQKRITIR